MPRTRRRLEDRGKVSDGFLTEASKLASKGFKDYIRGRLYRTINPLGDYNIKEHGKQFIKNDSINYPDKYRDENGNLYIEFEDAGARLDIADDIWANYLQIPKNQRRFNTRIQKSNYVPRKGGDKNETYYRLPLNDYEREILLDETNDLNINGNKVSNILANYNLADHTIGRGFDNKGEYRSYYDRFDLNPFSGKYQGTKIPGLDKLNDVSLGIGKPVNIYDRIYLDDYYGVKQPTHGIYLPEITVRGKRSLKIEENNMPRKRIYLDDISGYNVPTDAIQVYKPDTLELAYPNLYIDKSGLYGLFGAGIGRNMHGQLIDYNNKGSIITEDSAKEKAKKYYESPRQIFNKKAKAVIYDMMIDKYRTNKKYKDGGSIHIAPSKRGTFTAAATKHGMGVQEFAARVLRNKDDYSPSLVKKANFARNASKWNH